jgi:membrane-associated phospholipid phosphatase
MNISIKDVLQQIRLFFILYLFLLIACLLIKLTYSKDVIYYAVNSRYTVWEDFIAPYITDLGNGWTAVVIVLITVLFNYRKAFLMATTFALTSLLAQIIKFIFDAPRPQLYFKDQLSKIHFVKAVEILSNYSFPSGHTTSAFSVAVLITYLCKNKNWGIPLFIAAVLVGYSRMYLSEHFFEDVMAGSVLGVFATIFWIWFIENKKFIHTAKWNRGLLRK